VEFIESSIQAPSIVTGLDGGFGFHTFISLQKAGGELVVVTSVFISAILEGRTIFGFVTGLSTILDGHSLEENTLADVTSDTSGTSLMVFTVVSSKTSLKVLQANVETGVVFSGVVAGSVTLTKTRIVSFGVDFLITRIVASVMTDGVARIVICIVTLAITGIVANFVVLRITRVVANFVNSLVTGIIRTIDTTSGEIVNSGVHDFSVHTAARIIVFISDNGITDIPVVLILGQSGIPVSGVDLLITRIIASGVDYLVANIT